MKKIIRKWAIWFFAKQIKVYGINQVITGEVFANMPREKIKSYLDHTKFEMIRRLAEKMYEEDLIEFEEREMIGMYGREYRAKIRVI